MGIDIHLIESGQLEGANCLALPNIYLRFDRLMNQSSVNIEDFARIVQTDPGFAALVLQVVNDGEIKSLARAIKLLGIQQLHMLMLSQAAMTCVPALNNPLNSSDTSTVRNPDLRTDSAEMTLIVESAA